MTENERSLHRVLDATGRLLDALPLDPAAVNADTLAAFDRWEAEIGESGTNGGIRRAVTPCASGRGQFDPATPHLSRRLAWPLAALVSLAGWVLIVAVVR